MYTCYVIDDDLHAAEAIVKYIAKTPGLCLQGMQTNPLLALEEIRTSKMPDIVFLDVEMPELSGLDIADILGSKTIIIFITAYADFALNAYQKDVFDFLLKPVSFDKFTKSVTKIYRFLDLERKVTPLKEDDHIYINPGVKGKIIPIALGNINYIEALDNYVRIHCKDSKVITYLTMKEIISTLPENKFLRIHRSYIVNLDQINMIDGNQVILNNNIKLPFGISYKEEFMSKISLKTVRHHKNGQ